jgi:hypothetical protein
LPSILKSPSYQQNHFHMLLAVSPHLHIMQVSLNRALRLGVCDANLFAAERRNNFYSPALRFTSGASGADRVGARVCISLSLSCAPEETLDSLGRKLIIRYLLSCVSRLSHNIKNELKPSTQFTIPSRRGQETLRKTTPRALERVNYFLCAPSVRQRNTQIYLFTMCTHTHIHAGRELWRLGQEEEEEKRDGWIGPTQFIYLSIMMSLRAAPTRPLDFPHHLVIR